MNLREIDRLVATKVMGWKMLEIKHTDSGVIGGFYDDGEKLIGVGEWSPTSDIRVAWQVVEKLSKDGCDFQVWREKNGKYNVEFSKDFFYVFGFAESETAPLAICLAALKAVGVEAEVNEQ